MTKLEKKYPEVARKAEELGLGKIYYQGGEWWVGDGVQLTYRKMGMDCTKSGGGKDERGLIPATSWEFRRDTALHCLLSIEEGRKQPEWGDLETRINRVLEGLRSEAIPTYRQGFFSQWRHLSLDQGVCLGGGSKTVWLNLVGQKGLQGIGTSWEAAMLELEEKAKELLGGYKG